jgi:transcriptional regulator with XRE-family HTH domain
MTEETYRKEFGIRLRRLLRMKGMTQSDLADAIGITNAGLSGYINGKHTPSFYMVNKIARVLKCSVDELRYIG